MVDFNSPLGRRAFAQQQQQQKTLTIPDETTITSVGTAPLPSDIIPMREEPQQFTKMVTDVDSIQSMRAPRIAEAKRIAPSTKQRIEILAGLGRVNDALTFNNIKFSLQSLKSGEMRDVVRLSNTNDKVDSFFEARRQTLARSLYAIDDQSIDLILGAKSLDDILLWIDSLEENFVEMLHDRYLKMIDDNKSKFTIVDEKDAEEVAAEIKKS